METALYFANENIQIVSGKASFKNIKLKRFQTYSLNEGILINGIITNYDQLLCFLKQLRQRKEIPSSVRLVLDSSNILLKRCVVPYLNEKQLTSFTMTEFENTEFPKEEMVFDYSVIERKNSGEQTGTILCCAAKRSLLQSYIELFQELGVKLISIDVALNVGIKLIQRLPQLNGKTYLVSLIEKKQFISILFVKGGYVFSNRSRLFSEEEGEEMAIEIMEKISSMLQFSKAEQNHEPVENVYFCGLSDTLLSLCGKLEFGLTIGFAKIPEYKNILIPKESANSFHLADYFFPTGCLLTND